MTKRFQIMAYTVFWPLTMLVVLSFVGCGAANENANAPEEPSIEQTAEVELDIFSGRPNPTWSLSETDTVTLLSMLEGLEPVESQPLPDNLGYRGFRVRLPDPQSAHTLNVRAYSTRIEVSQGDNIQQLSDPQSDVAWWLLDQAAETAIENDLYEVVATELRQSGEPQ